MKYKIFGWKDKQITRELLCKVSGNTVTVYDDLKRVKSASREHKPNWSKTYHVYAKVENGNIIFSIHDRLINLPDFCRICSILTKDKPYWKFWEKPEFLESRQIGDYLKRV